MALTAPEMAGVCRVYMDERHTALILPADLAAAVRAAAGDRPWSGGCRFLVGKRATRTQFQQSH